METDHWWLAQDHSAGGGAGPEPMWANTWIYALDQQTVVSWKCKVRGIAWKPDQLAHSVNLLKPQFSPLLNEDLNSFCLTGSLWLFKEINAKWTIARNVESSQYHNQLKKCEPGKKFGPLLSSTVKGEYLEQHCPIECHDNRSVKICTVSYGNHMWLWDTWNVASTTEDLIFDFI